MMQFRTGIGRLTAPMLNGIAKASAQTQQGASQLHRVMSTYSEAPERLGWVLAQITGATAIVGATNRWEYDWTEVEPTATAFATKTGGYTSAAKGKAWNLCEAFNDGTSLEGPGWSLTTAPTGFEIKPISDAAVQLWLMRGPGGAKRYVFSLANVLDGECP